MNEKLLTAAMKIAKETRKEGKIKTHTITLSESTSQMIENYPYPEERDTMIEALLITTISLINKEELKQELKKS